MPQRDLSYTIIELMQDTARNMKAQPVNLGGIAGTGGGEGGPPGGFIGWLPQTRVAYDTDEAATLDTVGSGTLLDNLNHIRYRLQTLEAGSGVLIVDEWDGSPEINLVERLTFSGAIVTEVAPGHALVQITGSGGGASDFLDLTDTPSSYTGHAGKAVAVKDTEDGLEFVVMEGGDLSGYVPYVGATQNVNLGNRNITVSGESRLGLTQIREGNYLQIGANGLVFGPSDPDIQETSSFIAFGEGFGGGNTRLQEYGNQGMFGVTVDADTGPVLLAGYTDGFEDIEAKLGDIDGEFYHGYHLKIYSGGAEFNSNLNLVGDFTYNINGVPHTHSGGSFPNPFALAADITPAALTGNVNNYEPTGAATADVWRLSTDGSPYNITGIVGGADGRILILHNVDSTSQNITLVTASASSTEANRFDFGNNIVLRKNRSIALIYDATASRWKLLASGDSDALRGVAISASLSSAIDDDDILFYNAGDGNLQPVSRVEYIFSDAEGDPSPIGTAADGTSTFAARRDHIHAITNGSAVLGSAFSITGTAGTYQATGLSVPLPSAGTYKITGNIRGALIGNAGTRWEIYAKLYNTTDTADVANSETLIVLTGTTGVHLQNTAPIDMIVTVDGADTIEVYAARNGGGTPSWTLSQIASDTNGRSRLMYEKIG